MTMSPTDLRTCIQNCWNARNACQISLYNNGLDLGGAHASRDHVDIMTDCIEICQTAADFMVRRSPLHIATCAACAEVCEACAGSCDAVGDHDCAQACRTCAISCRAMADMHEPA